MTRSGPSGIETIARYPDRQFDFVGVMAAEGGSGRIEVMVTITGCHATPCQLMLNLFRQSRDALERELRGAHSKPHPRRNPAT